MRDAEDAQEELDNKLFGGRVLEVSSSFSPTCSCCTCSWTSDLIQCIHMQDISAIAFSSDGAT